MIRKACRMSVNPDQHAEYERRHNPIWKELEDTLKSHGASNYSIFLDPATHTLFAYVEIESEERWNAVAQTAVSRVPEDEPPSTPSFISSSRPARKLSLSDTA